MFAGSGDLPQVSLVVPQVTPAAPAAETAKGGSAAPDASAAPWQPSVFHRGPGALLTHTAVAGEEPADPLLRNAKPESPFRWQAVRTAAQPKLLTLEELDAAAAKAGWPRIEGWWPEMRRIITEFECPSLSTHCFNGADPNGGSYGLSQLNGVHHFQQCSEDFHQRYDPVVNLRTALCLRAARGRFGGEGGWAGADELGIY